MLLRIKVKNSIILTSAGRNDKDGKLCYELVFTVRGGAPSENRFLRRRAPAPGKRSGTRTAKDAVQGPTFSRGSFRSLFSDGDQSRNGKWIVG